MIGVLLFLAGASHAEEGTDVCLKTGTRVRAVRIEIKGNTFSIYLANLATPMQVPIDQVASVGAPGAPCGEGGAEGDFGIRGSNSIGERLMPMLIDAFARKVYGAPVVFKPKPGLPEEQFIEIRQPKAPKAAAVIDFRSKGTGTAPEPLKNKQIAFGMMSRRMKDEEIAQFKAALNLDPTDVGNEHIVGLDGIAVIVHPQNPIKSMSLEQIAKVFAGEVINWKNVKGRDAENREITGPNLPITVRARDDVSGTFDTFKSLVLEYTTPKKKIAPGAVRYQSSEALSDAVEKDKGSIGFIAFPYVNRNHPLSIDTRCGLKHPPNPFEVKLESYPLSRRLFLYTAGDVANPIAKAILDFSLSDEAQKTVVDAGFIDQSVEYQHPSAREKWLETFAANPKFALTPDKEVPAASGKLTEPLKKFRRSSIVFRFKVGDATLDNLAMQHVGRLARYLERAGTKRFLLVGFADSTAGWRLNFDLARDRARKVAEELRSQGISVADDQIISLSYLAPVACNNDEKGRSLNRRVEVWIAPEESGG